MVLKTTRWSVIANALPGPPPPSSTRHPPSLARPPSSILHPRNPESAHTTPPRCCALSVARGTIGGGKGEAASAVAVEVGAMVEGWVGCDACGALGRAEREAVP